MIIRPVVDKLVEIGILPKPMGDEYSVVFPELINISDKDRADLTAKKAKAISDYLVAGPLAEDIIPREQFVTDILGMEWKGLDLEEAQREENAEIEEDELNA